jgi:hypothetical protein
LKDEPQSAKLASTKPRKNTADWPDAWLREGYNGALVMAANALRYLSRKPRPSGGEDHYNSEHLLQIANDLDRSRESLLTPPAVEAAAARVTSATAPVGWKNVLMDMLAVQKRRHADVRSASAHSQQEHIAGVVTGIATCIEALSSMKQPEPNLDEMTRLFEDSELYFHGESPLQRREWWSVWKLAFKAALPHRLPPVSEDELRAIASDIADGFGGALTADQMIAIHESFKKGLIECRRSPRIEAQPKKP